MLKRFWKFIWAPWSGPMQWLKDFRTGWDARDVRSLEEKLMREALSRPGAMVELTHREMAALLAHPLLRNLKRYEVEM